MTLQGSLEGDFSRLANALPTIAWVGACGCDDLFLNDRWFRYVGRERGERGASDLMSFLHADDLERVVKTRDEARASGAEFVAEARIRRHDGEYRWFRLRAVPQVDGGQTMWFGSACDVHEVGSLRELQRSEERFRLLARASGELIWELDMATGDIWLSANPLEMFGPELVPEDNDGPSWVSIVHPDDRSEVERSFQQAIAEGLPTWSKTYRAPTSTDTKYFRTKAAFVYDADGRPLRAIGGTVEVTARMRLEQDMLRAQRTETIGRLAGGVAHDLNNVLSPILVTASLLEEQLPEHRDDLGLIISSAQRGSRMINRLLGFARGSESELEPLDVGALVVDVLRLLRDAIPKSIAFETELARGLYVQGDETQLHQVLTNLVVNARDALPGGGTLTIHTRALELSRGERTSNERGPSAGKYVVIEVADTGIGIPLELQDAVFDPYFTTKEIGKGTGLGLSTSATILDRHSGFLTVESTLGQGTTFKAFLPQIEVDEVDADDARESKRRAPQQSGAVVLVVDDEPAILQSVERLLLASGYRVKTASDGIEGLAVFDASPELDLVITDVMMPGMSGDMLVQAMRERQPNVRILAWSGRVDAGRRAALDAHIDAFLAKPFSAGELRELVEQVLRGS